MRLAIALGWRSVREMEEGMGSDEFDDWLSFHRLYDLPDGFMVTAQICSVVAGIMGGKSGPEAFAPYYKDMANRRMPTGNVGAAIAFLRQNEQER